MPRRNDQLVLHLTESAATIVRVRRRGDRTLLQFPCVVTPPAVNPDELAIAAESVVDELTRHVHENGWTGLPTLCLIGGAHASFQMFDVPALKGPALANAIRLKLTQNLLYDINKAVVWSHHEARGNGHSVTAVAMQEAHALLVADVCERIGLRLDAISTVVPAVAMLGPRAGAAPGTGLVGLLYLDERAGLFNVFFEGRLLSAAEIPCKLADFTAALMRPIIRGNDVVNLEEPAARQLRDEVGIPEFGAQIDPLGISAERILPLLEPVIQQLTKQMIQWFSLARAQCDNAVPSRLAIVGPAAAIRNLDTVLGSRLHLDAVALPLNNEQAEMEGGDNFSIEQFLPATAAALADAPLPDLLPRECRVARRIDRARRLGLLLGPAIAASLMMMTYAMRNLAGSLATANAAQQQYLQTSTDELARWTAWQQTAAKARALQGAIDAFAGGTPRWIGVFKELSNGLPPAVCASDISVRMIDGALKLRLTANSQDPAGKQQFDEIVEQTLSVLQASPFFDHVEVLSATRSTNSPDDPSRGELILDLTLAYARTAAGGAR